MPYYEVMFETGHSSIANYENDEEAMRALGEHHRRAKAGEAGGPIGGPAERIAKVYVYKSHPNDLNAEQTMSAEVLEKQLKDLVKAMADENGVVNVSQLSAEVRALTHPMIVTKPGSFDSNYVMKEDRELDLAFLEKVE